MKVIIVGGVAGGATTAARLRRMDEDAEIIMFEKGDYISYANCGLPYYIGGTIAERSELILQTPTTFGNRYDVDVRVKTEVIAIDRANKKVTCRTQNGKEYSESYDKLVLSPGSVAVKPPIKGIDAPNIFTLRDVPDTDAIKGFLMKMPALKQGAKAVVMGAGFIGLEMAENLQKIGCEVTVVEKAAHVMPNLDWDIAAFVQKHLIAQGVKVFVNDGVTEFVPQGEQTEVVLESGEKLTADFVLVSVGVKPLSQLAKDAGLKIGDLGGISVNEFMQTSDENIYAVGDAVETVSPLTGQPRLCFLAGPTNKQARTCANNLAFGNKEKYVGAIGTAIAKVFDLTVGSTGLSEKQCKQMDIPYLTSITHTASHTAYYPGNEPVTIKIQFAPTSGRLLGAEVVGKVGVDKRVDLLAMTIGHNGTVYDLTDFDHAYAPPFSAPKDPFTVAGFVAENILTGKFQTIQCDELRKMLADKEDFLLIDVRSVIENRGGTIEGSVNYPVDELREYVDDIPTDKPIVVFCAIGLRGYVAARILLQNGFTNVRDLAGGYKSFMATK